MHKLPVTVIAHMHALVREITIIKQPVCLYATQLYVSRYGSVCCADILESSLMLWFNGVYVVILLPKRLTSKMIAGSLPVKLLDCEGECCIQ